MIIFPDINNKILKRNIVIFSSPSATPICHHVAENFSHDNASLLVNFNSHKYSDSTLMSLLFTQAIKCQIFSTASIEISRHFPHLYKSLTFPWYSRSVRITALTPGYIDHKTCQTKISRIDIPIHTTEYSVLSYLVLTVPQNTQKIPRGWLLTRLDHGLRGHGIYAERRQCMAERTPSPDTNIGIKSQ